MLACAIEHGAQLPSRPRVRPKLQQLASTKANTQAHPLARHTTEPVLNVSKLLKAMCCKSSLCWRGLVATLLHQAQVTAAQVPSQWLQWLCPQHHPQPSQQS